MPAKTKPPGTRPTQIRLTPADRDKVEAIRVRYGLPSASAAIRYAIETLSRADAKK
jgi:hypothetical protein